MQAATLDSKLDNLVKEKSGVPLLGQADQTNFYIRKHHSYHLDLGSTQSLNSLIPLLTDVVVQYAIVN